MEPEAYTGAFYRRLARSVTRWKFRHCLWPTADPGPRPPEQGGQLTGWRAKAGPGACQRLSQGMQSPIRQDLKGRVQGPACLLLTAWSWANCPLRTGCQTRLLGATRPEPLPLRTLALQAFSATQRKGRREGGVSRTKQDLFPDSKKKQCRILTKS